VCSTSEVHFEEGSFRLILLENGDLVGMLVFSLMSTDVFNVFMRLFVLY